ncbi:MAG: AraC family transcriptional regulator, partial [Myxococcales bacterium]
MSIRMVAALAVFALLFAAPVFAEETAPADSPVIAPEAAAPPAPADPGGETAIGQPEEATAQEVP